MLNPLKISLKKGVRLFWIDWQETPILDRLANLQAILGLRILCPIYFGTNSKPQ